MKLMNSDTHSCTHSLASFDTFAVPGKLVFMIRATFAICHQQRFGQSLYWSSCTSTVHSQAAIDPVPGTRRPAHP